MANSNNSESASASASIENGSDPGVANAANTNRPNIRPRRHDLRRSYGSTPTRLSMTINRGNSKLMPKTSSRLSRKPKYCSPDNAVTWTSLPTVSRKCSAFAITMYANTAPVTKSTAPTPTNAAAKRRSLRYRPGVMNAQISCSQTGQARMMPAVSATLSRNMNWSNGAVANNRHWPSGAIVARAEAGSEQYGPRSHSPRL